MAAFDSDYKAPRSCGDSDGGHIAVAVKKGTDPAEVWVSTSPDGATWSEPILMDTIVIGSKAIDIYQESIAGSTRFVVTNGSGFMKYSDAFGAESSWMDY